MRNVLASRDIVNSSILKIVGNNPSIESLRQPAEQLAEAERLTRQVVRGSRKRRANLAVAFSFVALIALAVAGFFGYFGLFQGGEIGIADIILDRSIITMDALLPTLIPAVVGVAAANLAISRKDPTDAETINTRRLRKIAARWDELKLLGFPKSEIKKLRKQR